ncbi:hypothetical protein Salat_2958900 [Sesamum alatum]|uniref:Uncharacterized protein n=1 Tax=Sesamum alatum TaxID=300844 RepID=A0AAE2C8N8_9LAMI|nr:hypothetical protein Salat_2958900 [Sesamum alatum]
MGRGRLGRTLSAGLPSASSETRWAAPLIRHGPRPSGPHAFGWAAAYSSGPHELGHRLLAMGLFPPGPPLCISGPLSPHLHWAETPGLNRLQPSTGPNHPGPIFLKFNSGMRQFC